MIVTTFVTGFRKQTKTESSSRQYFLYTIGKFITNKESRENSSKKQHETKIIEVCQVAFCKIYGISKSLLEQMQKELSSVCNSSYYENYSPSYSNCCFVQNQQGRRTRRLSNSTNSSYCYHTTNDRHIIQENLINSLRNGKSFSIVLAAEEIEHQGIHCDMFTPTKKELSIATTPNGLLEKQAVAWMGSFFRQVGDQVPNSNEIHLESQPIKPIWEEYCNHARNSKRTYIAYATFTKLWKKVFPYVKLWKYKH